MLGLATGGILNMILDPILIFKFNMGVSGAAIAYNFFSQFCKFLVIFAIYGVTKRNKMNVTIKFE